MTSMAPSRTATGLSPVIAPLVAVAAGIGLLALGIYRDPAWLVLKAHVRYSVTVIATVFLVWAVEKEMLP